MGNNTNKPCSKCGGKKASYSTSAWCGTCIAKSRNERTLPLYLALKQFPCDDCGLRDPDVIEFDHARGEKKADLGAMLWSTPRQFAREALKCDIVCANCHVRRSKSRGQYGFK